MYVHRIHIYIYIYIYMAAPTRGSLGGIGLFREGWSWPYLDTIRSALSTLSHCWPFAAASVSFG